jgi:hypothetical protein
LGKKKRREKKRKEKKKEKRVLWTFRPFGRKSCYFNSPIESTPHVKPQLKLFCSEPELYQTAPYSFDVVDFNTLLYK